MTSIQICLNFLYRNLHYISLKSSNVEGRAEPTKGPLITSYVFRNSEIRNHTTSVLKSVIFLILNAADMKTNIFNANEVLYLSIYIQILFLT
jgi:hypothetical protein